MKKLFLYVFLGLLFCNISYAFKVTSWKVINIIKKPVFVDANVLLGKIQYFGMGGKGKNEGPFFNCPDGGGLNQEANVYTEEEFFNNKVFKKFLDNRNKLNIPKDKPILAEYLSCAENGTVFGPFIQVLDSDISYYLFDGGIFELENIYK